MRVGSTSGLSIKRHFQDGLVMVALGGLPLNFHPVAVRASTTVTPFGAVSVPA
jgi:hypothetical protein